MLFIADGRAFKISYMLPSSSKHLSRLLVFDLLLLVSSNKSGNRLGLFLLSRLPYTSKSVLRVFSLAGSVPAESESLHARQPGQQEGPYRVPGEAARAEPVPHDARGQTRRQTREEAQDPHRRVGAEGALEN